MIPRNVVIFDAPPHEWKSNSTLKDFFVGLLGEWARRFEDVRVNPLRSNGLICRSIKTPPVFSDILVNLISHLLFARKSAEKSDLPSRPSEH